jgi:choline-glycine betaine transporter
VTSGLPFSIIVAFMCWGLVRQLRTETIPPVQGTTRKTPAQQRQAAE